MDSWQPQEQGAQEVYNLLHGYLVPGANQGQIWSELQRLNHHPDFNNYLVYFFCSAEGQPVEVRQAAGLVLKNNLKTEESFSRIPPAHQAYIKAQLVRCLGSPDRKLRSTVGSVISVILQHGGVQGWPDLLPIFINCLDSNDYNQMEGAMDALFKICEDMPEQLDADIPGLSQRPIDVFFPRFLQLFSSPHAVIKRLALSSANQFIVPSPRALIVSLEAYVNGLFSLASDPEAEVRKLVCAALVQLVTMKSEFLQPTLPTVIQFMLHTSQESNSEVAMEASEFWSSFCEAQLPMSLLQPVLPQLVPVLLKNMRYEDDDETVLDAEEEGHAPDTDQDMKPRFYKGKAHGLQEEEEEEDDSEAVRAWNLRKSSAAALDNLSAHLGDSLLDLLMPPLQTFLMRADEQGWKEREAAVLALGAVSEGCFNAILPLLPQIVSHLLPLLQDKHPLVRCIACWTLSRYASWLVQCAQTQGEDGQAQFDGVLLGLLKCVLDANKRVQEAACSALACLTEQAWEELPPRLEAILQHLMLAFQHYQRANLLLLYDCLGTLAECLGAVLSQPKHLQVLMPPLTAKWQQLPDTDRDLFPLFACLTAIATALGAEFAPYAETVFGRCLSIIRTHLQGTGSAHSPHDKDFLIYSLDLLSGMAEGWSQGFSSMVSRSDLPAVLLQCCSDESADVRQSAFALLGDLAKDSLPQLQTRLPEFFSLALAQLAPEALLFHLTANNACWALGEIAMRVGKEPASTLALPLLERIVPVMSSDQLSQSAGSGLVENCAITLGRLSIVCPDVLAPHMPHFMMPWCRALRMIRDGVEKEEAFNGFCALVAHNPTAASQFLPQICQAICSWQEILSAPLKQRVTEILHGYSKMLGGGGLWDECMRGLDPKLRQKLYSKYGV